MIFQQFPAHGKPGVCWACIGLLMQSHVVDLEIASRWCGLAHTTDQPAASSLCRYTSASELITGRCASECQLTVMQEYETGRQKRLGKLSFVGHSIGQPLICPFNTGITGLHKGAQVRRPCIQDVTPQTAFVWSKVNICVVNFQQCVVR